MKLDKVTLPLGVLKSISVDTKPLNHSKRSGNATIRHGPHQHVRRLGVHIRKVPEIRMCRLRLRDLIVRLWLAGVDQICKLDGILDEEDGDVVSHEVPVAFFRVEFDSKSANISDGVGRTTTSENGGETEEEGRLSRRIGQDFGVGYIFGRFK